MPAMMPFYCNPFFPGWKEIFYFFYLFFEKFFHPTADGLSHPPPKFPETPKHRPRQPPQGPLPPEASQGHAQQHRKSQIPAADPEAQIHRRSTQAQQKQRVPQIPAAKRAQKIVAQPQPGPQPQGSQQLKQGLCRGHHPNRRFAQPPRGSSYTSAEMVPSTATCPPSRDSVFSFRSRP